LYKEEAAPVYPVVLILWVGYGFASIFQWNRPLLLALGEASFPVKAGVVAGLLELILMFTLTPRYGYQMHAAILSLFFLVSISLNLWRGLNLLNRHAEQDHPQS